MDRAYLSVSAREVAKSSDNEFYGLLSRRLPFDVDPLQRSAWEYQIQHLRQLADELTQAHFFIEFLIPRMGRRADLIIAFRGIIFVVEYKLGARHFDRSSLEQVYGYGLDLKHFHETSHDIPIMPILVATNAADQTTVELEWDSDKLAQPIGVAPDALAAEVSRTADTLNAFEFDPADWANGRYRPTPTIVEAAQALYSGHDVEEISRSEAGAENLTRTADYVARAIETAKCDQSKIICFITGVPGSGKTLAGLNLATARQREHHDEHAVFLSGNGPLVEVLREALAIDAVERAKASGQKTSKTQEHRNASAFIQNIHHFRDEALEDLGAPIEKVAIFDEAQRAWDEEQTSKFMQQKRGQVGFSMSEPEFLLSVMDRHDDWCAIICLVGGGQEINTGEAGVDEWLRAIVRSYPHWQVHVSSVLETAVPVSKLFESESLHLATAIRSFRAEKLSDFVAHVINGDAYSALQVSEQITNYPLKITRDLNAARKWLRSHRRGTERAGLLASSNAARLKPEGIFVKSKIEPARWFLSERNDVRSSDALEDAATEFDVQGLELDWACICWDANFRRVDGEWRPCRFRGSRWEEVHNETQQAYLANSYRVLLTRARQGMVIYMPKGSDEDHTRDPNWYDDIYRFLVSCGFESLS